jgi:two-component system chemotaxis response regulator CheB
VIGTNKIRVLVVDDSAFVRKMMTVELGKDKQIEVVGTAQDPYFARDKILELKPDVILLDIEMPKMDGLTFLRKLMASYPCRVIIVSSLSKKNSEVAMKAFEFGALEEVAKPSVAYSISNMSGELIEKIKQVAQVPEYKLKKIKTVKKEKKEELSSDKAMIKTTNKIIAIGASTGGTEAIKTVLEDLPNTLPPIMIVQHMPPYFTKSFADRLDSICSMKVKEAEDMELLSPGKALIAPGNIHMELKRSGALYYAKLVDKPRVFHQRPSVEILFDSVAKYAGKNALGVILTGMGRDGAQGLLNMKNAGAYTIAQDEKSSIVFGMPKEAINLGAADKVAPLDQIGSLIKRNINR